MKKEYALAAILPAIVVFQAFLPMIVDLFTSVILIVVAGYVGYRIAKAD